MIINRGTRTIGKSCTRIFLPSTPSKVALMYGNLTRRKKIQKWDSPTPAHCTIITQPFWGSFLGHFRPPAEGGDTQLISFLNKTQGLINTLLTRYKSSSSDNFSSHNKRFCKFSLKIGLKSPVFSENWTRSCRTM